MRVEMRVEVGVGVGGEDELRESWYVCLQWNGLVDRSGSG
jgi:hypothetical protein